jgi:hypothetical protein
MRFLSAMMFALISFAGVAAAQQSGKVVREVVNSSELLDVMGGEDFQDTSIQAAITPRGVGNVVNISVDIPSISVRRVEGSPKSTGFRLRVVNKSTGAVVCPPRVYGVESREPDPRAEQFDHPAEIRCSAVVSTRKPAVFAVQASVVAGGDGRNELRIKGNESGASVILTEIEPLYPSPIKHPGPILGRDWRPKSEPEGDGWVVWPNVEFNNGKWKLWAILQNAGKDSNKNKFVISESDDPKHWPSPSVLIDDVGGFVTGMSKDEKGRYWAASFFNKRGQRGLSWSRSSDGMVWAMDEKATLPDNETTPVTGPYGVVDVNNVWRNPLDGKWYGFFKWLTGPEGLQSSSASGGNTRGTRAVRMYERKDDFEHWEDKGWAFRYDELDPGVTEFYGASRPIMVGDALVSFIRILRDDFNLTNSQWAGVGFTEIAVCRSDCGEGRSWIRERRPFLDRGEAGSWDAAMAWVGEVEEVDGIVYMFYMGFGKGHKVGNREVGLATISIDDLKKRVSLILDGSGE